MKKLTLIIILGFFSIWILSWCSKTSTEKIETIKIGVIAPLSWPAATVWEDMLNITQIAVEEFNKDNKTKVELIIEDGKCSGKDATSATNKLINIDKVDLIFGWECSSEMIASSEITQPLKILNFSAASSSPIISKIGDYVYRFYNDMDDARFLSKYIQQNNISKIGIVYENSDYAISYINTFKWLFSGNIIFEKRYDSNEKDFDLLAQQIKNERPEIEKLVFIPQSDTNFISIIKSLTKYTNEKNIWQKILTTAIARTNTTFETIPDLIEWVSSVMLPDYWLLWEKSNKFINELKPQYTLKTNELYAIFFKERIDLILRAINKWNYTSEEIKNYITSFNKDKLIDGYRGKYYFNGSDTIGLKMVIQQVQSWSLVTIQ